MRCRELAQFSGVWGLDTLLSLRGAAPPLSPIRRVELESPKMAIPCRRTAVELFLISRPISEAVMVSQLSRTNLEWVGVNLALGRLSCGPIWVSCEKGSRGGGGKGSAR